LQKVFARLILLQVFLQGLLRHIFIIFGFLTLGLHFFSLASTFFDAFLLGFLVYFLLIRGYCETVGKRLARLTAKLFARFCKNLISRFTRLSSFLAYCKAYFMAY